LKPSNLEPSSDINIVGY